MLKIKKNKMKGSTHRMDLFEKFDRQKLQKITLIVITALTLVAIVLLLAIIIVSTKDDPNPDMPNNDIIDKINIDDIEFKELNLSSDDLLKGSLILVNSEHIYTSPADTELLNIAEYRNNHGHTQSNFLYSVGDINKFALQADAMKQAHTMLVKLLEDTKDDSIKISAAYGKDDNTKDIHTGYTMVLTVAGKAEVYLSDASNASLKNWLDNNAQDYGFVIRYPADKAELTGVSDYDYAFRYVGIPHSRYMKSNNLCLEEYIALLKGEHASTKEALIIEDGNKVYMIYYTEAGAGDTVRVPKAVLRPDGSNAYEYTMSSTNEGGVIVTVELK